MPRGLVSPLRLHMSLQVAGCFAAQLSGIQTPRAFERDELKIGISGSKVPGMLVPYPQVLIPGQMLSSR